MVSISYKSLKKDDLESALESYLHSKESTFAKDPKLSGFYKTNASPTKREVSTASALITSDSESKPTKPRGRRVTKVADEVGLT
jgi:hypothetical protein